MKVKNKGQILFVVDPSLVSDDQSELIIRVLQEEKIKYSTSIVDLDDLKPVLLFIQKNNLKKISRFKNKLVILPSLENEDNLGNLNLNFSSYEEITHYVKNFFKAEKYLEIQDRLKESERIYELSKKYLEERSYKKIEESYIKIFESMLDLEMLLMQEESIECWNIHFKNFSKKSSDIKSIILLKNEDLSHEEFSIEDDDLIYKLPLENYFLHISFKKFDVKKGAEYLELLLTTCLRTMQSLDHKLVKSDGEIDFWKQVFSKIPYPMSIISSLGDLLIYNESFAKIGILPKECLRFKDHDNAEVFQSYYKIRRLDFTIDLIQVSSFVFYTSEEDQNQKSGEKNSNIDDLGIISSSIAHELNNPLAGILAALSLLSLEDDWELDALSDIEDMKSGAKRCKELVEIFLGFSKFSPTAYSKVSISASLDQAINLLRFRMIESNLRIDIKYSATLESFSHQVNSSIMSMILYLVCSELMTSFAHHRLVTLGNHSIVFGELVEFSNQIVLKLDDEFEYEYKIAQSKLIQHLLIFEKLEINFLKQEIRLIYRS